MEPLGLRMAHGPLPAPLMRLLLLSVEDRPDRGGTERGDGKKPDGAHEPECKHVLENTPEQFLTLL